MGSLRYSAITSLDGYIADAGGGFEWATPDAEVHAFVNDCERAVGTYLYGRRMYDTMVFWETAFTGDDDQAPAVLSDYAQIWRAADKVVYSRAGREPTSARTRVLARFDAGEVRAMKAGAARDISVGGAELAGQVLAAGLVDECRLLVAPVVVGGGTRALPAGLRASLELLDERRFDSGVVHLHYRVS